MFELCLVCVCLCSSLSWGGVGGVVDRQDYAYPYNKINHPKQPIKKQRKWPSKTRDITASSTYDYTGYQSSCYSFICMLHKAYKQMKERNKAAKLVCFP